LTVAYQRLSTPPPPLGCIWALHSPIDIHANHTLALGFVRCFLSLLSPSHRIARAILFSLLWTEWAISPISCCCIRVNNRDWNKNERL
jgi:hypothetical protein